ncbi:MAG: Rrf2 family transcriptional regulator, cysteine metabolism repressor [Thermoleophilaceae bacterium]|jgi:Rrf2 family protein|nr:Rrf2 family transcriptional regulator, cysteine metabolism repressor [Thermoleophilaceae bacterium]
MIFSAAAEYGVRVMVELGRHGTERPMSLKAVAENEGLPLSYLEQIVPKLKAAGLIRASRGAHGGYWLARPAEEISMDEVVLALEGAVAPMECFVNLPTERVACSHAGDQGHSCSTKLLWMRVQGGIVRALQGTTLADLVEFAEREHAPASAAARA